MSSRSAVILSVEQFIEDQENENSKQKTRQSNVALLKEFLTLEPSQDLKIELPQRS